jgi:hypothetical protein
VTLGDGDRYIVMGVNAKGTIANSMVGTMTNSVATATIGIEDFDTRP